MGSGVDLLGYLIVFLVSIIGVAIARFRRQHRKISMAGTSVLLTYYTDGVSLITGGKGQFGEMNFVAFAGVAAFGETGESSLVYQVMLPYRSFVHLLGIPKKSNATQLFPAGRDSIMEPVVLEGDYPEYFTLYAEKDMQTESRYTLDPKAMVFTIDFCQSFNWEIVDNQLYIVRSVGQTGSIDDSSSLIQRFVKEIEPAIARPLTDAEVSQITPYGQEYRKDLKCPICDSVFINVDDYLACRNGDGILLKGTALTKLHAGALKIPQLYLKNNQRQTTASIHCPSCDNIMEKVSYNNGKTIIDACNVCPYRWLDAGDQVISSNTSI